MTIFCRRESDREQALLEYNAMQFSPYELFLAKSQEMEAERSYIDTVRDYWITRAKLERAVGGTLTPRKQAPSLSQDKTVVNPPRRKEAMNNQPILTRRNFVGGTAFSCGSRRVAVRSARSSRRSECEGLSL